MTRLRNVPDDWDYYWRRCLACGRRWHLSDGGCGCENDPDAPDAEEDAAEREYWEGGADE